MGEERREWRLCKIESEEEEEDFGIPLLFLSFAPSLLSLSLSQYFLTKSHLNTLSCPFPSIFMD
jgi:hypothetical protein